MHKGLINNGLNLILIIYIILSFFFTVIARESQEDQILTEWLWGYRCSDPRILCWDNFFNILLFVPIGFLVGLVVSRFKLIKAFLSGLFVSETVECSQLIWHRGTFDVDDLFNNAIGSLVGGLIVVTILWIRQLVKNHEQSVQ